MRFLLLLLISNYVYAKNLSTYETALENDLLTSMGDALASIESLDISKAKYGCSLENGSSVSDVKCAEKFSKLYSKPEIDMRVMFGYLDTGDGHSEDQIMKEAFISQLLSKCPILSKNIQTCGFTKDPEDSDRFIKQIKDSLGKEHKVIFTVMNSSFSSNDSENLKKYSTQQHSKTELAEMVFVDGLQNADVVIYSGHSRDGGGPDFNPPVLDKKGHVDYNWYHKNKPGLKMILKALEERKKFTNDELKILGIFSCLSAPHFQTSLKSAAPKTGFLLTKNITSATDDPYTLVGAINAILGQFCEKSFANSTNGYPGIDPKSYVYFSNFF
jgi:hypothetical protein